MISGQQALGTLDRSLEEARGKVAELEERIERVTAELVELAKVKSEDYRELARVRIDRLADNALDRHLDEAHRHVVALFSQRESALEELNARIEETRRDRARLESERGEKAQRVERAAEAVDAAEKATQARLDKDPVYRAKRDRASEAERRAMHAADKAARSEEEREEKGRAYRDDPLFMYLWNRNFGLPDYRASGLARWLDTKVARLVGFADARANFSRLNEIPQRLRAHAEALQAAAESEHSELEALDQAGREADGILPLDAALAEAQGALDAVDEEIAKASTRETTLAKERASFATGDDQFTRAAVGYLASEFEREDLAELRRDALRTPFPEDDLIVARIRERDAEREQREATLEGFRDAIRIQQERLADLESVRIDFKRNRFDRSGSTFQDGSLLAAMLGQFLQGMFDKRMLWRVLQEQQRYRPRRSDPTFGSGGFGRGTVWSGGIGDVLDKVSRAGGRGLPKAPRGGGGFRTGGGF